MTAPTPEQTYTVSKAGMQYAVVYTARPSAWVAVFRRAVDAAQFVAGDASLDVVRVTGLQWVQR
ncbi:hypothetical protein DEJ21_14375 [Curtobacterium sp. MCSS17_006]|uniref:hypothetical protein n=1 Tax=Curtobacterium sp. MCSS17_006 TaxID=2175642 RepID=UPI000DA88388|nr:hypothetical protein [Curtobacterium sp. MCSS17_006]PZE34032.1 hypothetical protein DEJ21_14375 [Curtobacterium sp. MCSS17_006]